jgi:L-iditol 2-dehydrogenase
MCEPLSVGIHACRRTLVGPDTNVLIIGGGPIGLISVLCARAFGAPRIVMADVGEQKLAFAKKLGADATILVSRDEKVTILQPHPALLKKFQS